MNCSKARWRNWPGEKLLDNAMPLSSNGEKDGTKQSWNVSNKQVWEKILNFCRMYLTHRIPLNNLYPKMRIWRDFPKLTCNTTVPEGLGVVSPAGAVRLTISGSIYDTHNSEMVASLSPPIAVVAVSAYAYVTRRITLAVHCQKSVIEVAVALLI